MTIIACGTYRWVEPFVRWFSDWRMELISEGRTLPVLLGRTALLDLLGSEGT